MFELHQWLYHLHNKKIHPESIWKSSFFAQYVACWRFFSWKGPRLVPWCVRGLILRAFFFPPCRAQSVHIGNEQQCGCDISENANTISTPPSLSQHQYLCAHGGGSEIPGPEFALSWQGKRLIRTHAPLLVTLPASPAQHATLDLNAFFFFFLPVAECAAMYELRLKCVTDLIRRECFPWRGAAAVAPFSPLAWAQRWPP